MSAGSKLIEGATEMLAVARGEVPAARLHVNGQTYVPLADLDALKVEVSRLRLALSGADRTKEEMEELARELPPLTFVYRNHEGIVAKRRAVPLTTRYGHSDWHPTGYVMTAFDLDRNAIREFAMDDIISVMPSGGRKATT